MTIGAIRCVGVVLVALLLGVMLSACGVFGDDTTTVALAESEESIDVGSENVDPLVLQFTPVVWLHRGEKYGPMSASRFIARSELTWRTPSIFKGDPDLAQRSEVDARKLGFECAGAGCYQHGRYLATDFTRPHDKRQFRSEELRAGEGFYLDPDGGAHRGEAGVEPQAPMYYEITRRPQTTRITYWFFYGFSVPYAPIRSVNIAGRLSHEGDWENIDVVLESDGTPRNVSYYGHGHPSPIDWSEVCKLRPNGEEDCESAQVGRPIVYSARHSHASYPVEAEGKSDNTKVCNKRLRWLCSYDMRNMGFVWDPLREEAGGLRDAQAEPWYGFGGAWGSAGRSADLTGPLGPSPYKLSDEPEPGEQKAVTTPKPNGSSSDRTPQ